MVKAELDEYGNKIVNEAGSNTFDCPNCGDSKIARSRQARAQSKEYKCPKCEFKGP